MGELENAWKSVTNAFKSLGSELKDQYEKATSDDRPEDEIAADRKGKSEVAAALDPASELRDDLKSDEDQEAALAAVDGDEDVCSAFDRARHYLEQAASTVGKVAKEDSTKKAAKDAASAMGDALSATFTELKKALKIDDDDETSVVDAESPAEDQSDDSGGSKSDGGSNPES
ncbi:MAG: hypothetical protein KJN81_10685 [Acidimicrobiia bacterium]|nr:hypothetical protein [Acidimicrobiia bacterium]NNL28881.1 hypothetical protein [Acidimicrobiia bacterium]